MSNAGKSDRRERDDGSARGSLLEELARRYSASLSRFFERRVTPSSDVPDLVQEVFLRLSRLEDLSAVNRPEHYLFATASSALKDRARRAKTRHADRHEPFDEFAHGGSDFSPERVLAGREALDRVRKALLELPDRTRDVFVLRVFEDQRMADIAQFLGISRRAVEKHYVRAMAHVSRSVGNWRDD